MVNDTLSDFVTRVRNGYMAGSREMTTPLTKMIYKVAEVMVKNGYLMGVEKKEKELVVRFKYDGKMPAITGIKRVSKPGSRIYSGVSDLPKVWGGLGINILSTPKGIVEGKEAKKLKSGGEILVQIW